MISTTAGQGFDMNAEMSTERRGSRQAWTTGKRGAWSHSATVTPEQGPVSRAPYDSRDTYEGRIYVPYGHDDLKQYQRDRLKDCILHGGQSTGENLVKPIPDVQL